jgi:hypothetical protein
MSTPVVCRHPGGLASGTADIARSRVATLISLLDAIDEHAAGRRQADPLADEGNVLTVSPAEGRMNSGNPAVLVTLKRHGTLVVEIHAEGERMPKERPEGGSMRLARTLAELARDCVASAAEDHGPRLARNAHRFLVFPDAMMDAWEGAATILLNDANSRREGVDVENVRDVTYTGSSPLSDAIFETIDGSNPVAWFTSRHASKGEIDPRLIVPGGIQMMLMHRDQGMTISLAPAGHACGRLSVDTISLLRAEAAVAALRDAS